MRYRSLSFHSEHNHSKCTGPNKTCITPLPETHSAQVFSGGGGGGHFLACKDWGERFDESFPARAFFFFFWGGGGGGDKFPHKNTTL